MPPPIDRTTHGRKRAKLEFGFGASLVLLVDFVARSSLSATEPTIPQKGHELTRILFDRNPGFDTLTAQMMGV